MTALISGAVSCAAPPPDEPSSAVRPTTETPVSSGLGDGHQCACEGLACGPPNCVYSDGKSGWYISGFGACGMEVSCCASRQGVERECRERANKRKNDMRARVARPPSRPPPVLGANSDDTDDPDNSGIDYNRPRVMTRCPGLAKATPVKSLIGAIFEDPFRDLPKDFTVKMNSSLGGTFGIGSWSLVSARRNDATIVLLAETTRLDPPQYRVTQALDLGVPCKGLVIETNTCAYNNKMNPTVFALMDSLYRCGGHAESTPARAWRMTKKGAQRLNPKHVTCGSFSCEVDPS